MEVHQNKAVSRIIQCFSLFLVLRLLEELLIIPRYVNTKGLVACIGGFAILLFYIRFINKPLEEIGMIFSGHKVRKGILLGVLFNAIPAMIVYALEYRHQSLTPGHTVISVFYDSVQNSYSAAGFTGFLKWAGIGLLIAVIHAFFYEMTFRGLLITLGSRSLHFWAINSIQTALYTFWYLIPVLRILIYYSNVYSMRRILTLFLVTLAYEILTAAKLGLLRSSTGSVWACIFDHIAFAYIIDMVHVQFTATDMTVQLDEKYYTRIIAYQLCSLLMVTAYYFYKKQKIKEKQRELEMRLEQQI